MGNIRLSDDAAEEFAKSEGNTRSYRIRSMTFNVANQNLSSHVVSRLAGHVFPHKIPASAPLQTLDDEEGAAEFKPTPIGTAEAERDLFICSTQEDAATWSRHQVIGERLAERAGYTTIFSERMNVRTKYLGLSSAYTSLVIAAPKDVADGFSVEASGVYNDTDHLRTRNKGGVWVKLRDTNTGKTLGVIGCHLDKNKSKSRRAELAALSSAVGIVDALMVAGDLNDMRRKQEREGVEQSLEALSVAEKYNENLPEESDKTLTDNRTTNSLNTYNKHTKAKDSSGPLDAVLHTNSIKQEGTTTVLNVENVKGLDHYPVIETHTWAECVSDEGASPNAEKSKHVTSSSHPLRWAAPATASGAGLTGASLMLGGLHVHTFLAITGVAATVGLSLGASLIFVGVACLIGLGVSAFRSKNKINKVLADSGDHALFKPERPHVMEKQTIEDPIQESVLFPK